MISTLTFLILISCAEYSWLESYLDNDTLFLENALNWEDAFYVALSDLTIYSFLSTPFFSNSHFFLDSFTKLSFIDIIFMVESDKTKFTRELYDFFIWDIANSIFNKYFPTQFFFYTDYQDYVSILLQYSPELIIALDDYINIYWLSQVLNSTPVSVFDIFNDSCVSAINDFLEFTLLFFFFYIFNRFFH